MIRLFVVIILTLLVSSCASQVYQQDETEEKSFPSVTHSYELTILDVNRIPLEGATVQYRLKKGNSIKFFQDTTVTSPINGKVSISMIVDADSTYSFFAIYNSMISYDVVKEGYYSRHGMLNIVLEKTERSKSATICLIKPTDYIDPVFLASSKGISLKSSLLSFIDILLLQSIISDSHLETQSINLSPFKRNDYLALKFISTNTYNSLKMNKYDIGKILFDEVIRKILNPLNDNLGESGEFFGYDLTVVGSTKSFAEKYALSKNITYRFLISKDIVKKYKLKDISGQQVLDSSIILMDDERIELKLQ